MCGNAGGLTQQCDSGMYYLSPGGNCRMQVAEVRGQSPPQSAGPVRDSEPYLQDAPTGVTVWHLNGKLQSNFFKTLHTSKLSPVNTF